MKQLKIIIKHILHPPLTVIFLQTPICAALTIYIFATHRETTVIGIVSHVLAAYTLAVVIINIKKITTYGRWLINQSRPSNAIQSVINKNKYTALYMEDKEYRARVALYIAMAINVGFAVVKLLGGVYYESFWYGADAFFYIVLSLANFLILRFIRKYDIDTDPIGEYKLYRLCGIFLFVLVIALVLLVIQIVYQNRWFEYPNAFVIAIAAYTFACLITAIFNVFSYRKLGSPALSAAKAIRFARALVAIFALQTAMLHTFADEDFAPYRALFNALTGGGVCLFILAMAVNMVYNANKNIKRISK